MDNINEIINKMKELREKRELEILDSQLEKINLNSDYQKDLKNNRVLNVKYLGEILLDKDSNKQNTSIFMLIEQIKDKKGNLIIVEKYYTEDLKFLGGNNRGDGFDFIMLNRDHINDKNLLDNINNLDKEGKLDLAQIERRELEEIAKALGTDEKDIQAMSEIDLVKEIEENNEDGNKKDNKEKQKDKDDKNKELNKKETKKVVNTKQEIKINTKIDNKKTIGQALKLDSSEYTKIAIVYSDKLQELNAKNEKINNTRYSFVAIRKDGTAKTINDKLELDSLAGNNSYKDSIKIDADKTARKDDKTRSRYKINGKEEFLSVENGQYGEIKAYYEKGRTREKNENIGTQIETDNIRPTSIEIRRMQADYKGKYNTDKMVKEANEHFEEHKDKKVGLKSVDGNKDTIDHLHIEANKESIEAVAKIITKDAMKNSEVEDVFTSKEVEEMSKNYLEKNIEELKELDSEKLEKKLKKLEDNIIIDANNIQRQRK